MTYIEPQMPDLGFGSIFDWIPIYQDSEYNQLLYNPVTNSENYDKWCFMSVDDHGRCGFYTLRGDINKLKEELEQNYTEWQQNYPDDTSGWEKVYNIPIKIAMNDRGMQVHYG